MAPVTRDYYADLELPANADISDVKKQFRKLGAKGSAVPKAPSTRLTMLAALKYHPDRNPGREQEVNSKFQTIQTAHETLSDPQQKARYDATLGRSNRGGGHGARGNPWANVSQQFPTPPRRNTNARTATSGAQRWQTRFSNGVPPTAKQGAAADPEAKKNAARAFENMRKTQSSQSTPSTGQHARPSQPPPPPPRTESARQRAEASFGTRRTGFQPRSAVPGDEPTVSAASYYSRANTEQRQPPPPPPRPPQSTPMADPLSEFRNRDTYGEPRHSAPYCSHGGERTNPFDGVPLGRAKSSRETYRRDEHVASDDGASTSQRGRSSSVPRAGGKAEGAGLGMQEDDTSSNSTSFKARASSKAKAETGLNSNAAKRKPPPISRMSKSANAMAEPMPQDQGSNGPSMYDSPHDGRTPPHYVFAVHEAHGRPPVGSAEPAYHDNEAGDTNGSSDSLCKSPAPSGRQDYDYVSSLTLFELQQHLMLDHLIRNQEATRLFEGERGGQGSDYPCPHHKGDCADETRVDSFTFSLGDDAFEQTAPSPDHNRLGRSSVDDINTQFVDEEQTGTWRFSAGNGETQPSSPTTRSSFDGLHAHESAAKRPAMAPPGATNPESRANAAPTGFNPAGWSDKIGPQNFVPQPTSGASVSPTRRANSKKVKARPTAGNAAVVETDSSSEEMYDWRGRNAGTKPTAADSPQAMDIDTPPPNPMVPSGESNGVRNIPVEPTRPEWRPGHVNGVAGDMRPPRPVKLPIDPNTVGSEDSEDIRASFADLKNVAPFAQQQSGLRSLDDLKDNLPFESKASGELPIKMSKAQPLAFPCPPEAPRLPPTVAIDGLKPNTASWVKYLEEFEVYLREWDDFNGQVVDHFATRKAHIAQTRASKGYAFLGARGEGDIQSYYHWLQQDNDVRQRWNAACEEHERRYREFMAFREKMKQAVDY